MPRHTFKLLAVLSLAWLAVALAAATIRREVA